MNPVFAFVSATGAAGVAVSIALECHKIFNNQMIGEAASDRP
jgi:hypothetical protein